MIEYNHFPHKKKEIPTPSMGKHFPHLNDIANEITQPDEDANVELLL